MGNKKLRILVGCEESQSVTIALRKLGHEARKNINLIQKLAGHSNVKTTSIYLHISHNHISKIQSPLSNIEL